MPEKIFRINTEKLEFFRISRGIRTRAELAERAGIHPNTLYRMLQDGEFKSSTLEAVASALNVNPIDLITVSGFPSPHMEAPAIPV